MKRLRACLFALGMGALVFAPSAKRATRAHARHARLR